jgi:hypothetical protein
MIHFGIGAYKWMSRKALVTLAQVLSNWGDGTIGISMFGQSHLGLGWVPASQKMTERNHDLLKTGRRQERKKGATGMEE